MDHGPSPAESAHIAALCPSNSTARCLSYRILAATPEVEIYTGLVHKQNVTREHDESAIMCSCEEQQIKVLCEHGEGLGGINSERKRRAEVEKLPSMIHFC